MKKTTIIHLIFAALCIVFIISYASAVSTLSFDINISENTNKTVIAGSQVSSPALLLKINTDVDATCKYSDQKDTAYDSMSSFFELEYGKIHKKTINSLIDGQYKSYVKCKSTTGNISQELEIIYVVNLPITAQISLENGLNIKDGKTDITLITSKVPKTTPTLSYTVDSTTYKQIPLIGSDKIWTGYIIIAPERENEVGSFKFQARDLEDNIGTEITSGAIFTIDTIPPNGLLDIEAEGVSKGVNLTWKTDEEGLVFNIYKSTSPGVSYSDFYKSSNKNSYLDTDITAKTTYYYRISSLDGAGNEGPLSNEVAAISTLTDKAITNGLDLKYVGLVESFIEQVDSLTSTLNTINANFNSQEAEEKEIFGYLKLTNSINSAKTSISALRSEVNTYTSQSMSKTDIDKKINSAEVRLNIIKSNIPESMLIKNKKEFTNTLTENDLNSNILEIKPELDYNQLNKISEKSWEYLNSNAFVVKGKAYNVEVSYLDNTQKKFTIVKKNIEFNHEDKENTIIIESIPKEIAESTSELNLDNNEYEVIKEDPIISFSPSTSEIVYHIKREIDLSSISKTKTFAMNDNQEYSASKGLTGYVTLEKISEKVPSADILIGIAIIVVLGVYWIIIKNRKSKVKIEKIEYKINNLYELLDKDEISLAVKEYSEISGLYKTLQVKEQRKVYPELNKLHRMLIESKKEMHKKSVKNFNTLSVIFISMFLIITSFALAIDQEFNIIEGKNNVTLTKNVQASELISLNPQIQSITYYDQNLQKNYAYINVFGGIGKNFMLETGKEYEIMSKENITLRTYRI